MTLSLPPDLQRLVRDHLAVGEFHSEADVLRAALHMLDDRSPRAGIRAAAVHPSGAPASRDEPIHAAAPSVRRSPRGMLADIASHISADEIAEARAEMWTSFPRGEA